MQYEYEVWDIQTGARVGPRSFRTRRAAQRMADKLNQEYGAHRYAVDLK